MHVVTELKHRAHHVRIAGPFRGGRRGYGDRPPFFRDEPVQKLEAVREALCLNKCHEAIVDVERPSVPTVPSYAQWLAAVTSMADGLLLAKRQLLEERAVACAAVRQQRELLEDVLPARMARLKRAEFVVQTGLSLLRCLQDQMQALRGAVHPSSSFSALLSPPLCALDPPILSVLCSLLRFLLRTLVSVQALRGAVRPSLRALLCLCFVLWTLVCLCWASLHVFVADHRLQMTLRRLKRFLPFACLCLSLCLSVCLSV